MLKIKINLNKGGTNVNKSPPASSIQNILKQLLSKMNIKFEYNIKS